MKLVNMKLPPPEPYKPPPETVLAEGPKYPWGLCLRLDDDALTKLGIADLPDVGTEWTVVAKARVTSARAEEYAGEGGSGSHKCLELQITDLGLEPAGDDEGPAADKLYAAKA
jgi:hypothetical protein